MIQGFSVSWSSNMTASLLPQLWKPKYDSLWPCIGNIVGEGQRGWRDPSHIHASFIIVMFVSRVCLHLFRRVLLCRHPVCVLLFEEHKSVLTQTINYITALSLLVVLHPSHWPHSWAHSLLGNDPTFYLMDCISNSPLLPFFPQGRAVLMPFQG